MSCCGRSKAIGKKIGHIVAGTVLHAAGIKYEFTDGRIRACHKCDEQTWMSLAEYNLWLLKNGVKVLENFTQLEKLPKLPKYEQSPKRRRLYCRICKCFIPGKARIENEHCPLDKWERPNNRVTSHPPAFYDPAF